MPKRLTPARGRLTWIQVSFSFSFCVDLIAVASGNASPSARYLRLEAAPVLSGRIHGIPPSLDREELFPPRVIRRKRRSGCVTSAANSADVKDSDGEFAYHWRWGKQQTTQ